MNKLEETLMIAFSGLYMRDIDGNFMEMSDRFGVLRNDLKKEILKLVDDALVHSTLRISSYDPKMKNLIVNRDKVKEYLMGGE